MTDQQAPQAPSPAPQVVRQGPLGNTPEAVAARRRLAEAGVVPPNWLLHLGLTLLTLGWWGLLVWLPLLSRYVRRVSALM